MSHSEQIAEIERIQSSLRTNIEKSKRLIDTSQRLIESCRHVLQKRSVQTS